MGGETYKESGLLRGKRINGSSLPAILFLILFDPAAFLCAGFLAAFFAPAGLALAI